MATTYKIQAQYPATSAVSKFSYISNKAITSNLATITTAAVHGITQVGTLVKIQGVDTTFDGTYTIHSIPTTTTFTFVSTTATVASTAVSPVGVATFSPVTSGYTITNRVIQNYIATITSSAAHGLSVGDFVAVTIGTTGIDTTQVQVIGIPTTTTFSYLSATQTLATGSVSQGSFCKTTFQSAYTVPAVTQGVSSTLYISNNSTATQYYRIAAQLGGGALANQYIAFDQAIAANATAAFTTGLALNAAEVLTMQASSNLVTFTLDGSETA